MGTQTALLDYFLRFIYQRPKDSAGGPPTNPLTRLRVVWGRVQGQLNAAIPLRYLFRVAQRLPDAARRRGYADLSFERRSVAVHLSDNTPAVLRSQGRS